MAFPLARTSSHPLSGSEPRRHAWLRQKEPLLTNARALRWLTSYLIEI